MEAVFAALPKFNDVRLDSITAPVWWARDVVGKLPTKVFEAFLKLRAIFNGLTLVGGPRPKFAAERS